MSCCFPVCSATSRLSCCRSCTRIHGADDDGVHPATLPPADLLKQTQEIHTRRSGPGGQHRNKTQTAVVLLHKPTGIAAEASER